jgi:Tol biopolymer transport system component
VAPLTNPRDTGNSDLWLFDLVRGGNATRFTYFPAMRADFPLWSADGKQVLFTFAGPGGHSLFRKDIGSSQEPAPLLRNPTGLITPTSSSPDGRFVMYAHTSGPTLWDLFVVPLGGNRSEPEARRVPFAPTRFNEEDGRFSPDGEWVAYVSNESGANEVYLRRFNRALTNGSASVGTSVLVSKGGGSSPRWRRDGKELFYLAPGGTMMAVAVALGAELSAQAPVALFQGPDNVAFGDVTADGQRFLLVERGSAPFTVVLNWMRD